MRFAITAIDRYLGIFEALIRAGWEPVKLFTVPLRNLVDSNHGVIALAERHKIPIQLSPMTADDLQALSQKGCDVLIIASYNWKIPDWQPYLKYAVNFHASPLPEGRGPYPAVRAILEKRDHWAVACHKVTADMDKGDVLAEENFSLSDDECHESIDLKIQMAAKRLAFKTTKDFEKLWAQAKPQTGGSYWPRWKNEERIIDFSLPVERIMRQVRAFGLIKV
ncbi:MAG TPA: hypothetical protein VHV26_03890, partial [Rhizomicrobium sp.]|nr:hypothetical protein [Rhizomicrobium sp.]